MVNIMKKLINIITKGLAGLVFVALLALNVQVALVGSSSDKILSSEFTLSKLTN